MVKNVDCAAVRGFNYQPSYARNGLDSWLDRFDPKVIEHENPVGKESFSWHQHAQNMAFIRSILHRCERCLKNIDTVIDIGGDQGLRFIPVLFNGWHSLPDFGGVSFEQIISDKQVDQYGPYVEELVGRHTAHDPRVAIWDLCNEPFNSAPGEQVRTPIPSSSG